MYILAAAPPDNRDEEEEEKIHDTVTPELSQQRSQTYDRQTHSWEELLDKRVMKIILRKEIERRKPSYAFPNNSELWKNLRKRI